MKRAADGGARHCEARSDNERIPAWPADRSSSAATMASAADGWHEDLVQSVPHRVSDDRPV